MALDHFILSPICSQNEIRNKIGSFIWEQNHFLIRQVSATPQYNQYRLIPYPKRPHNRSRHSSQTRQDGELVRTKGSVLGEKSELEIQPQEDFPESPKRHFSGTSEVGKKHYNTLQNYPVNNMAIDYISIDELKKFQGDLHDFIPGTSGYVAYILDEVDNFSILKNKLKKK
ncbi:telomere repeats-binding bouquet formation protein 2 [Tachyglossus aculeatus]|uniref:telomere repeats-binding bouquet formation protein 2 n=1 Tax=Tachyglossus aculeatus TaxID=9261 RepID=UPI0018F50CF3|nr:telomere repeats-binding bouquet formation protein 2 [Tachyglossus aculeatus]